MAGTVTLDGVTRVTEVRGRGNSTWGWAKKPYKLKLEDDAALVGSREYDEWVLLAGYADRSSLRTAAAFAIAAQTRFSWTPRFRFVEVVLNGRSQGLYMLTEQVEEGKGSRRPPRRRLPPGDQPALPPRRRAGLPHHAAGRPSPSRTPTRSPKSSAAQVRRAVSRFENGALRAGLRATRRPATRRTSTSQAHRLVPRRGALRQPGLQLPVERELQLGAREALRLRPGLGLRPQRRHPAGRPPPRPSLVRPASGSTGSRGCCRTRRSPRGSRAAGPASSRAVDQVVSELPAAAATLAPPRRPTDTVARLGRPGVDPPRPRPPDGEVAFLTDWLTQRVQWLSSNEVRHRRHPAAHRGAGTHGVGAGAAAVARRRGRGRVLDRSGRHRHRGRGLRRRHRTGDLRAGQTERYVPVQVLDDRVTEGRETVLISVTGASGNVVGGLTVDHAPSSSTPTPDDGQRRLTAAASQGSGQGLNRHPPVPLDCCIMTGARPRRWHPACPRPSQWPVSWLTTRCR